MCYEAENSCQSQSLEQALTWRHQDAQSIYPGVCLLARRVSLLSAVLVPLIKGAGLSAVMCQSNTTLGLLSCSSCGDDTWGAHQELLDSSTHKMCVLCYSFPTSWHSFSPPSLHLSLLSTKPSLNAFFSLSTFCCICTQIWYFDTIA